MLIIISVILITLLFILGALLNILSCFEKVVKLLKRETQINLLEKTLRKGDIDK